MAVAEAPKVPPYDELMWPALKALKAMGGSASNEELLAKIIELEKISEGIKTYLHTDHRQTKLGYNLAWAKTYLKRVGAVENSTRGVWSLTSSGEGNGRKRLRKSAGPGSPTGRGTEVSKAHSACR